MRCASCDREIAGVVCDVCSPSTSQEVIGGDAPVSHHALAGTVRRLKGLVMASFVFGWVVAPFAFYLSSRALGRYGGTSATAPAVLRQLTNLRRVAAGLLIFWAFVVGGWIALLVSP